MQDKQTSFAPPTRDFTLFKITKAKAEVDISSNTLRAWERAGRIRFYRAGKLVFASRPEVEAAIRAGIPA